jgi:hypothetical protein
MVQLKILAGKKAGTAWAARRFPVRVGRDAGAHLRAEEDGVWEQHLRLDFAPAQGVILSARPEAPTRVNGHPVQQALLRNGDTIELGALRLQFWLSETRQRGLGLREAFTWAGIVAIGLGQVAIIYLMLR